MIILISGGTHTGKTKLAQKLLEKYHYPYLSLDHLKMGLIRSNSTDITVDSTISDTTNVLWPIVKEMIKTAIENKQNMIIEGCYIPFDYQKDFDDVYLKEIKYICLILTDKYINSHFEDVIKYNSIIEQRIDDCYLTKELLLEDYRFYYNNCLENNLNTILIDDNYDINLKELEKNL